MDSVKQQETKIALYPSDSATKVAGLGVRFAVTLIAWLVLGKGISLGQGFFVSLFLFSFPLLTDYLKFVPNTLFRRIVRRIGIILSGIWVILGIIGAFGVLTLTKVNEELVVTIPDNYIIFHGSFFPVSGIWCCIGFTVLLTSVDWVIWESDFERWLTQSRGRSKKPSQEIGG